MNEEFVRERITQLRLRKNVSEYQMSYDLGHSRGYVYNISSGKSLPPFKEFFPSVIILILRPRSSLMTGKRIPSWYKKHFQECVSLMTKTSLCSLG